MNDLYNEYVIRLQKIADINYSSAVLQWDQEVYMPVKGAGYRAQQLATLAGISHELSTEKELGALLEELHADKSLGIKETANVLESLRVYKQNKKYTTDFVIELNKTVSESFVAWQEAKAKNDYSIFKPKLQKLIELKRKECELLGYEEHPYDAMLNLYEPGLKTSFLTQLFADVREKLVPYVKNILNKPQPVNKFLFTGKLKTGLLLFFEHFLEAGGSFSQRRPVSVSAFAPRRNVIANGVSVPGDGQRHIGLKQIVGKFFAKFANSDLHRTFCSMRTHVYAISHS